MSIGIFVNSKTGNTLSVAEKLRDRLAAMGHKVVVKKVVASTDNQLDPGKIVLTNPPSTQGYGMLVFASPVNGTRLAPGMPACLQSLPSPKG